jgi:hypothetical protein
MAQTMEHAIFSVVAQAMGFNVRERASQINNHVTLGFVINVPQKRFSSPKIALFQYKIPNGQCAISFWQEGQ